LQHHPRADSVGLSHQIAGIAEREGYDPRSGLQCITKGLRIQTLKSASPPAAANSDTSVPNFVMAPMRRDRQC
jgi:hypothetical protein